MTREEKLAKRLEEVYTVAEKELRDAWNKYSSESDTRLASLQKAVDEAKTPEEKKAAQVKLESYARTTNLGNQRYTEMLGQCTSALADTNAAALKMINGELLAEYLKGFNSETNTVSATLGISFSLMSDDTLRDLLEDDDNLLPTKHLDRKKDEEWNQRNIHNAVAEGLIEGDSVPEIANRLAAVTTMNQKQANRNARTMINGANNRGRTDAQKSLSKQGVNMRKRWSATLDSRVRDSHAALDGETVSLDAVFSNGCSYPGDPSGRPEEVYNCRCRLETVIEGFDKASVYAPAMEYVEAYETISGVQRGLPMSYEQADNYKVNPNYSSSSGYQNNCQACAAVFEARQRGYDVQAKANNNKYTKAMAADPSILWIDPATGNNPQYVTFTLADGEHRVKAIDFALQTDELIKEGERWELIVWWDGEAYGHVVNIDKNENGELRIKDNQKGPDDGQNEFVGARAVSNYLEQVDLNEDMPRLLRIDNVEIKYDAASRIMSPANKKNRLNIKKVK